MVKLIILTIILTIFIQFWQVFILLLAKYQKCFPIILVTRNFFCESFLSSILCLQFSLEISPWLLILYLSLGTALMQSFKCSLLFSSLSLSFLRVSVLYTYHIPEFCTFLINLVLIQVEKNPQLVSPISWNIQEPCMQKPKSQI